MICNLRFFLLLPGLGCTGLYALVPLGAGNNFVLNPQEAPAPAVLSPGASAKPLYVGLEAGTGPLSLDLLRAYWYVPGLFIFMLIFGILFFRARLRSIRRREREKSLLQQQLVQTEMKALRSQMNPHFIFNAINSIQHYVLTSEKELANKYLVKFSKLMRNILDLSKEEQISLKEELETVRLYLEIEALRFNNAFVFSISVDPTVDQTQVRLPPLLIQPFVENAIWHGLLLKEGQKLLHIDIHRIVNDIVITIDDNGIGREMAGKFKNDGFKRRSLGMDITQSRLHVLAEMYGTAISFIVIDKKDENGMATGTRVVIEIKP